MSQPTLESTGHLIIDDFIDREECQTLLGQIDDYRKQSELLEINRPIKGRSLRYSVIDGKEVRANLPSDLEAVSGIGERPGERARWRLSTATRQYQGRCQRERHASREIRVSVALRPDCRHRNLVSQPSSRRRDRALSELSSPAEKEPTALTSPAGPDRCLQPTVVRRLFGNKKVVEPHPGRLVVMRGNRCWHSVRGVQGFEDRISIILAYDPPGARFEAEEGLDSYLYTQETANSKDPNYAP